MHTTDTTAADFRTPDPDAPDLRTTATILRGALTRIAILEEAIASAGLAPALARARAIAYAPPFTADDPAADAERFERRRVADEAAADIAEQFETPAPAYFEPDPDRDLCHDLDPRDYTRITFEPDGRQMIGAHSGALIRSVPSTGDGAELHVFTDYRLMLDYSIRFGPATPQEVIDATIRAILEENA